MNIRLRPLRLLTLLACLAAPLLAQDDPSSEPPSLLGQIDENNIYTSPDGFFRIQIPVLAELDGTVQDTSITTTFRDPYGVHISIGSLPLNAEYRAELDKRGRKDFLAWLFSQHVQPEYQKAFPGTTAESAKYLATTQDGSLLVMNLLPGGTAFRDRVLLAEGEPIPVAKRGSLVFLKGDRVVIITTELYERILKRDTFKKTPEEEDAILRKRLLELLAKMTFPTTVPSTSAAPAAPAPAVAK
ncbi:hypothetical protein [Nibricoccus aquaticus]|nr:hypothetical protein [Nibricoccus aquaticus]